MNQDKRRCLWNEINKYVMACGGNPDQYIHGNRARMKAAFAIEDMFREAAEDSRGKTEIPEDVSLVKISSERSQGMNKDKNQPNTSATEGTQMAIALPQSHNRESAISRSREEGVPLQRRTHACTLVYSSNGFAWVRYGALDSVDILPHDGDLETDENPKAIFNTLESAFIAAVRMGHRPTHWVNPNIGVRLKLDHAPHWLRLAGLELDQCQ